MPWAVVRRPSLAFHIFEISSRTLSWIELKLSGRHCGSTISMAAILKFFKRHLLPNRKTDWAETWWEASQWHRFSEFLKSFCHDIEYSLREIRQTTSPPKPQAGLSWNLMGGIGATQIQNRWSHSVLISKMATMATILKFFKPHLLPNHKSTWAETWWEA